MAEAQVGVLFTAEDNASAVIDRLRGNLDTLSKKVQSYSPLFQGMAVAGTAAFAAVSGEIYTAINAAGESAKVQAQLNAALLSTHGAAGIYIEDLNDQSAALQKMTTYSDEAVGSAQAMMLTFTNVKGGVFQESIGTILDMSTALGQDLKSSSIQVGKALNDPILGIAALHRVGVSFTDQQKEQIKTLVESGKTMDAQRIILKELNTEFGGSAAAAAGTFTGQIENMKNRIDNVQESIGGALIPVINELLARLVPIVDRFGEWAAAHPELIKNILLAGLALSGLLIVIGGLGLILPAIIAGVGLLLTPIGLGIIAFTAITAALLVFHTQIAGMFQTLDEKTGLITFLKDAWNDVVLVFQQNLMPALTALWDALQPFKPFLDALVTVFGTMLVIAIGAAIKTIEYTVIIFSTLITKGIEFVTWATNILVPIFGGIGSAISSVVDWVEKLITSLSKLNFIQGAKNAISGALGAAGKMLGINDGIVQNGNVITTHPDDYIIATKDPSSLSGGARSINININGAIFTDDAARRLGDILLGQLQMQMKN